MANIVFSHEEVFNLIHPFIYIIVVGEYHSYASDSGRGVYFLLICGNRDKNLTKNTFLIKDSDYFIFSIIVIDIFSYGFYIIVKICDGVFIDNCYILISFHIFLRKFISIFPVKRHLIYIVDWYSHKLSHQIFIVLIFHHSKSRTTICNSSA